MRYRALHRLAVLFAVLAPLEARAFCGFYVASGDAKLFNQKSQVALVRDGDRTVLTMAADYEGDPRQFAMIVPVPVVLQREQIHVGESSLVAKLDAYSAPRLVEYHDPDPCPDRMAMYTQMKSRSVGASMPMASLAMPDAAEGVRIEARYEVEEYDVLILSASDSHGLLRWLERHGYRVPGQAATVVESYLKQGMKFFVAKVDLRRRPGLAQARAGGLPVQLRPLQIAYESPRFMLPVRLGLANANGPQELFVYAVTRGTRVEPANYRSVKLPESVEVPGFVKREFAEVWRAGFDRLVAQHGMGVVFTEYAWDMNWCDPCPSPPLSRADLRSLGVWWLDDPNAGVFLTRLHARYDRASFPEDLVLQVTQDRQNFQSRVIVRHEWKGEGKCEAVNAYRQSLPARREREAHELAAFTGWPVPRIRERMGLTTAWVAPGEELAPYRASAWWEKLWK